MSERQGKCLFPLFTGFQNNVLVLLAPCNGDSYFFSIIINSKISTHLVYFISVPTSSHHWPVESFWQDP